MEHTKSYIINRKSTIEDGIEKYNYLLCTEPGRLSEDEAFTDFPTLLDFDVNGWEYQNSFKKEPEEHYSFSMHGDWIRYIDPVSEELVYGELISYSTYIEDFDVSEEAQKLMIIENSGKVLVIEADLITVFVFFDHKSISNIRTKHFLEDVEANKCVAEINNKALLVLDIGYNKVILN